MNSTRKRSAKALEVSNPIVMGRSEVNLTGRAFEPSSRANCGSGENLVGDILLYRVSMSIYMLIYKKPREEAL